MTDTIGAFRTQRSDSGLVLLFYGPRDLAEAKAGVPQAAFALWDGDKMVADHDRLAAFVNAGVAASHGDFAPMNKLCPPKVAEP